MTFQLNLNTETVGQAYPEAPLTTNPQATIAQVLDLFRENAAGSVLVCVEDELKGIFTERDAIKIMASDSDIEQPISNVMVTDVVTTTSQTSVQTAIEMMAKGGFRQLPIVDDNKPTGVLRVAGILRYLVEHFPNLVYTLPPNPDNSTQAREGA